MITAPRQIVVLGLMLAVVIAAAAALSAEGPRRGPAGITAPILPRAGEPVATLTPRQFDQRWSGSIGAITLASR